MAGGLVGAGMVANVSSSPQEFQRSLAFGRQLMEQGIVGRSQQDMAMQVAAGVAASGATDKDRDLLLEIGKQKRVAPGQLGEFSQNIARFGESFGPEAGSFQDIAKQFIRAGSDTLGVAAPDEIGRQAADVAQMARDNGISPTKALAAFTTYARTTKSARRAAQLTKDYIEGKGDMSHEQAARFAIETQTLQGVPGQNLPDYLGTDVRFRAARGAEEVTGERTGAEENMTAELTALYERLISRRRQEVRERYGFGVLGGIRDAMERFSGGVESMVGTEATELKFAVGGGALGNDFQGLKPEDIKEIKGFLQRQTEMMERGDRQPPPPNGRQE